MNTVMVLFQSGLEHAEEIPHCSQPLIPSHPSPPTSKKNPLLFKFSFNCFKYFSRGLATFLFFYTSKFSTKSCLNRQETAM